MRKVKVSTSYNVPIEYSLAGVGERVIANILDYIFKGLYYLTFYVIFSNLEVNPEAYVFILASLPIFIYNPLCEILMEGQTLGMRLRKIKVISLNGKQTNIGQYLIRWLFRIIDISISSGAVALVSVTTTKKGQRLGDLAAGTTVVSSRSEASLEDTIFTETEEDYQVLFPEVHLLSDSEVEIIKETLAYYRSSKKGKVMEALALKVQEKLNIQTEKRPHIFLDDILKDYNHLHSI